MFFNRHCTFSLATRSFSISFFFFFLFFLFSFFFNSFINPLGKLTKTSSGLVEILSPRRKWNIPMFSRFRRISGRPVYENTDVISVL